VWIKEAQAVLTTLVIQKRFTPPREAVLHGGAGSGFEFWLAHRAGVPEITRQVTGDLRLPFTAAGRSRQSNTRHEPDGSGFIRIGTDPSHPKLAGLWLKVDGRVEADLTVATQTGGGAVAAAIDDTAQFAAGRLAGIEEERQRWLTWLESSPDLPEPPIDPGGGGPVTHR
jgi:hypothetical protein